MSNIQAIKLSIDTDVEKLKAASESLDKENVINSLCDDPQRFLKSLGIHVDEATAAAIANHASSKAAGEAVAAAVVHIDF
ncbi:hypothetical protein ACFODZ_14845 [Marinicella sediminis]|uniref:Uncharacterized protein n=1 Tax=Marinicella sediminis TaxID=1792834 RepID=A0ABV7JBN4_9GAMM|nr:hypothetical protein [Marinicella sediminis]